MKARTNSARVTKRVARKPKRDMEAPAPNVVQPNTDGAEPKAKLSQKWRNTFLEKLAETSHVRSACEAAGVGPSTVYDLRRRDAGFAEKWMGALCEGYDNLEMELLHRLRSGEAAGAAKFDAAVAFRMLQAHRENVVREKARRANVDAAGVRAAIDRKVAEMRALVLADKLLEDRSERASAG
jgi:hypothetical protein